jgi:3-hydroxybutyryl-CoA dehydrogenase
MKIVVITDSSLKDELLTQGLQESAEITWLREPASIGTTDCIIDLLFHPDKNRVEFLRSLSSSVVMINSVSVTLKNLPENFVRINGWPTFLKRILVEASSTTDHAKVIAENIFTAFGKKTEWTPDIPGFISARVVSTIINEAYFTLEEKVSSKQEIDTAMKLGTNYPYGPFEWSEKIGLKSIYDLLQILSKENRRYEPCPLLKKEALA